MKLWAKSQSLNGNGLDIWLDRKMLDGQIAWYSEAIKTLVRQYYDEGETQLGSGTLEN